MSRTLEALNKLNEQQLSFIELQRALYKIARDSNDAVLKEKTNNTLTGYLKALLDLGVINKIDERCIQTYKTI